MYNIVLQPFGVVCSNMHNAQLGLFVYNVVVRDAYVMACMNELCVEREYM